MNATLELPPTKEALHQSVAPFISQLVKSFQRKFGGDWYELLSEANCAYAEAVCSFKPELGWKFDTWVGNCIFFRFQETLRQRGKEAARATRHCEALEESTPDRHRFDLDAMLREASPEARTIMKYVLDAEVDREEDLKRKPTTKSWRSVIVEHFCDLGWEAWRIIKAIDEIRDVLTSR